MWLIITPWPLSWRAFFIGGTSLLFLELRISFSSFLLDNTPRKARCGVVIWAGLGTNPPLFDAGLCHFLALHRGTNYFTFVIVSYSTNKMGIVIVPVWKDELKHITIFEGLFEQDTMWLGPGQYGRRLGALHQQELREGLACRRGRSKTRKWFHQL